MATSILVVVGCSSVLEYPRHPQATAAVSRLLTDDPLLVKEAQVEIKALGPGAMPALRDALTQAAPEKQIVILDLAISIGTPQETLEEIIATTAKCPVAAIRETIPARVAPVAARPSSMVAKLRGFTVPETLLQLLNDESSAARLAALRVLSKIEQADVIPPESLTPLFHDPEQLVRVTAILIAAERGTSFDIPGTEDAPNMLLSALGDQRPIVRATAAKALGTREGMSAPAVPALIQLLHGEKNEVVRLQIAVALSRIGTPPALASTIPVLRELSQNQEAPVRVAATAALARAEALSHGTVYSPPQPYSTPPL